MAYDAENFTPPVDTKSKMRAARAYIAEAAQGLFNMAIPWTDHACNSPACIMGWTAAYLGDTSDLPKASVFWGFSEEYDRSKLFFPGASRMGDGRCAYDATLSQALQVIDHYIATGEVDWSVAE